MGNRIGSALATVSACLLASCAPRSDQQMSPAGPASTATTIPHDPTPVSTNASRHVRPADFVPGELLVKYRTRAAASVAPGKLGIGLRTLQRKLKEYEQGTRDEDRPGDGSF